MKEKIWILGKNGLLGKAFCELFPDSIATSKEEADITDQKSLFAFSEKHPGITHIINASGFTSVDLAESEKQRAHLINGVGPEILAKVALSLHAKLMHISTDYVFDGKEKEPLCEMTETNPINYYGKTKLEGEERLLSLMPRASVIRTSFLFGKGGKNFVSRLIHLLETKEELFLSHDQINSPTYANDLAKACFDLKNASGIFHFSNQGPSSKYEFGKELWTLLRVMKKEVKTKTLHPVSSSYFPSPCMRPLYTVFDTRKIESQIPFSNRSWQESLKEFIEGELS